MKGRSRTNRRFSSVYNATPSAPVSAMTIAGLTPAAPYSPGSARISAYQMTPSPRRLAIWKIRRGRPREAPRSEEHTSELQSPCNLVCRLLLEKKKQHQARSDADADPRILQCGHT